MSREDHPVWTVYDKMRTACLNVKYYSRRLQTLERLNFAIEFFLGATASSSGFAALWFWKSDPGQAVWKYLTVVVAIVAVAKPLLSLTKRIKDYESILSGYRTLEYDLREIRSLIEQNRKYDHPLQLEFKKALQREKILVAKAPAGEWKGLKRKCEEEVLCELPADSFYIPKEEKNNEQRKRNR